jgi:hypothetical protein
MGTSFAQQLGQWSGIFYIVRKMGKAALPLAIPDL